MPRRLLFRPQGSPVRACRGCGGLRPDHWVRPMCNSCLFLVLFRSVLFLYGILHLLWCHRRWCINPSLPSTCCRTYQHTATYSLLSHIFHTSPSPDCRWEGASPGSLQVIGFDMGGTSTDVSRFAGTYEHVFETTTAGVTIQAPQLDVNTVAAGEGGVLD